MGWGSLDLPQRLGQTFSVCLTTAPCSFCDLSCELEEPAQASVPDHTDMEGSHCLLRLSAFVHHILVADTASAFSHIVLL